MECAPSDREELRPSEAEAAAQDDSQGSASPVRWRVADLLRGQRVAIIDHGGEEYRLRLTANDKLILTK